MLKELIEKYNAKVKEIEAFTRAKGELITTPENQEKLISMQKEALSIGDSIEISNKLNDLDSRLNQPVDTATDIAVTSATESSTDAAEKKYENDFLQAIHTTADEGARNVLEVGIPARGGVLVPMSWDKELIRILEEKSPIRQLATNKISHNPVTITKSLGGASVDYVNEKGEFPETNIEFSTVQIGAHKVGGTIKVTDEIVQDSQFDIRSEVITEFGRAFEAADETAFLFGTGVNQPNGIIPGIPANMQVATAAAGSVTADDIIDLTLGVKQVVANTGSYFMNRATALMIYKFKDGDGRNLWERSLASGQPPTFYGKNVVILEGMHDVAANEFPILFGNLKGYQIWDRSRATLKVLEEVYATTGQIGFLVQKRFDGLLADTQLLAALRVRA